MDSIISVQAEYYNIESDSTNYAVPEFGEEDFTDDDFIEMSHDEREDTKYLAIFENNYDGKIMALEDVNKLKKMEAAMINRTNKGYYRCKIKHENLCNDRMKVRAKYCTPSMLATLQYDYSTQKNKSMNYPVATLALKTKICSKSSPLRG